MKRALGLLAVLLALALAGCGGDDSSGSAGGGGDCLTAAEVSERVDEIASGIETSSEDVEAKQEEIAAVRAEEC